MIRHLVDDQTDDIASEAGRTPTESTQVTTPVEPVPVHPRFGRRGQLGASLIEYVLMIAMVALVCIGALTYFGGTSGNSADHSSKCLATAGTPTYDCP
jgi:Flp pilus assembly pilin Flp